MTVRLMHTACTKTRTVKSQWTTTHLQALFYGSKAAKAEGLVSGSEGSHSKIVGRGKYVHEKITHNVIPSRRDEYLEAAEKYYTTLRERSAALGGVKLTGSWETVIGTVGEFTHILEYDGYKGYDTTSRALRDDKVGRAWVLTFKEARLILSTPKRCTRPYSPISTLDNTR